MKRNHTRTDRRQEEEAELNLIPVMNLFICLIPFLLLSAAFVNMGSVDVELPKAHAGEVNPNQEEQQTIDLIVQMLGKKIVVTGYRNGFSIPVESIHATFSADDTDPMNQYLTDLATKHAKINSSIFKAASETKFEDAIKVLSALRTHEALKAVVLATEVVN